MLVAEHKHSLCMAALRLASLAPKFDPVRVGRLDWGDIRGRRPPAADLPPAMIEQAFSLPVATKKARGG